MPQKEKLNGIVYELIRDNSLSEKEKILLETEALSGIQHLRVLHDAILQIVKDKTETTEEVTFMTAPTFGVATVRITYLGSVTTTTFEAKIDGTLREGRARELIVEFVQNLFDDVAMRGSSKLPTIDRY